MKRRNPGLCFLFTIISCGIYGLYWFVQLHKDINELANPQPPLSAGKTILLSIVTAGIYTIVWYYKTGLILDGALESRGMPTKNQGTIYLVLGVFALGFVVPILMQSTINSMLPE